MIHLDLIHYLSLLNSYYIVFFKTTYFLQLFFQFYIYQNLNNIFFLQLSYSKILNFIFNIQKTYISLFIFQNKLIEEFFKGEVIIPSYFISIYSSS